MDETCGNTRVVTLERGGEAQEAMTRRPVRDNEVWRLRRDPVTSDSMSWPPLLRAASVCELSVGKSRGKFSHGPDREYLHMLRGKGTVPNKECCRRPTPTRGVRSRLGKSTFLTATLFDSLYRLHSLPLPMWSTRQTKTCASIADGPGVSHSNTWSTGNDYIGGCNLYWYPP